MAVVARSRGTAPIARALGAIACVACALAGCGKGQGQGHASSGKADDAGDSLVSAPEGGAFDPNRVLARVGERTITAGDYAAAFAHMNEFDRLRYQAPERRRELLSQMIDVMLLADEARARGYDGDPEARLEIQQILRDAARAKAREGAPSPADIPASEVRAYYEAHRADFYDPERRRVSAIVLPTRAAAESVLAAAQQTDAKGWGELVRSRSVDKAAKADVPIDLAGDLGFVSPPGDPRGSDPRVPPEVRAAVFEVARVGEILPRVVPAGGLFYVVKLQSKSDAHERSLDDADRSIRTKLANDAAQAREDALVDRLRKEIPVEVDEAALGRVRVDAGSDGAAPPY